MRKQYHFRPSSSGLFAWDVDRLLAMTTALPDEEIPLENIVELDTNYWFGRGSEPTIRAVIEHLQLINEADLSCPIIVDPDGGVMDGMHRVAKALLHGHNAITARRLPVLPVPDFSDVHPDELPYD